MIDVQMIREMNNNVFGGWKKGDRLIWGALTSILEVGGGVSFYNRILVTDDNGIALMLTMMHCTKKNCSVNVKNRTGKNNRGACFLYCNYQLQFYYLSFNTLL